MSVPLIFANHALDAAGEARAWSCTTCGALVASKEIHASWHRDLDRPRPGRCVWQCETPFGTADCVLDDGHAGMHETTDGSHWYLKEEQG